MRILFLGDSLIEFCDWRSRFPKHDVCNAGLAGETVAGLLAGLPQIMRRCPEPAMIFLMIGTNNLVMEDYGFISDYENILKSLKNLSPFAKVICTGMLPIQLPWLAADAISRVNDSLRRLVQANGAIFLDLCEPFTENGHPRSSCFEEDGVHLSPVGYAVWASAMAALIDKSTEGSPNG